MSDLQFWGDFASPEDELNARRLFMQDEGYEMCGIAACNCNSWHKGTRHVETKLRMQIEGLESALDDAKFEIKDLSNKVPS